MQSCDVCVCVCVCVCGGGGGGGGGGVRWALCTIRLLKGSTKLQMSSFIEAELASSYLESEVVRQLSTSSVEYSE